MISHLPWPVEVVAIDDASTDNTLRLLRENARRHPWLRVHRSRFRSGQHVSVLSGMRLSRGALVLTMDADLEDRPEMIPRLLAALKPEWDMVVALRMGRARSPMRRTISWFLNTLLRRMYLTQLRDNGSMMRVYRRRLCERMVRWGPRRPFIPVLALELATSSGSVSVDVGTERVGSRYGFATLLHVGRQLLKSLPPTLRRHAEERPATFFDLYWSDRYRRRRRAHDYSHVLGEAQRAARQYAEPVTGCLTLELGAGLGEDAASLSSRGARVVALDSCRRALMQWDARGCSRVVGQAEQLPFGDTVFDRVCGRAVLMHVSLRRSAEECRRVLKTGGQAVFVEPLKLHPLVALYRVVCSVGRHSRPRPLSIHDVEAVGRLFRRCTHQEFYLLGALGAGFRALGSRMGSGLRQKLVALDDRLLHRFPSLRALAWICVMCFER